MQSKQVSKLILMVTALLALLLMVQLTLATEETSNSVASKGQDHPMDLTRSGGSSTPAAATSSSDKHPHDKKIEQLFEKARILPQDFEHLNNKFHEAWKKFKELFPKREQES